MNYLLQMGWEPFFSQALDIKDLSDFQPARIIREEKGLYWVTAETGDCMASPSGRLRLDSTESGDWPVVGDWVLVDPAVKGGQTVIRRILPRKTLLSRGRVDSNRLGNSGFQNQALAANVDLVFIVEALSGVVSLNRIERFLTLTHDVNAWPVVLLSKADLVDDGPARAEAVRNRLRGVETIIVSARTGLGIEQTLACLEPGRTGVLLGPSGVGKSTLINRLLDSEIQAVGDVREADDKGRHTTTSRQLFRLPDGGLIIDAPGLRSVGLTGGDGGLQAAFGDIDHWAEKCRYRDCRHQDEPGCAVRQAAAEGLLDREVLENFLNLRRETELRMRRADPEAQKRINRQMGRMISEAKRMKKLRF